MSTQPLRSGHMHFLLGDSVSGCLDCPACKSLTLLEIKMLPGMVLPSLGVGIPASGSQQM